MEDTSLTDQKTCLPVPDGSRNIINRKFTQFYIETVSTKNIQLQQKHFFSNSKKKLEKNQKYFKISSKSKFSEKIQKNQKFHQNMIFENIFDFFVCLECSKQPETMLNRSEIQFYIDMLLRFFSNPVLVTKIDNK